MVFKEVFLSYNTADRSLAGKIGKQLEALGFAAFLAHEDIEVSVEWRAEILRHLDSCSGLIAIVTENFSRSKWTNQEVGIAMGKGKPVVSLVFGESGILPGFLESLQGIQASEENVEEVVSTAAQAISKEKGFSTAYIQLATILNKFVYRWESYQRLTEAERRSRRVCHEMTQRANEYSEELFELLSVDKNFESGILHQVNIVFDYMKSLSRLRIPSTFAATSDFQEIEKRGQEAYDAARALLFYVKTKTG